MSNPVSCLAPLRTRTFHTGGEVSFSLPNYRCLSGFRSCALHSTSPTLQIEVKVQVLFPIHPRTHTQTYPAHLLTSSSPRSGCLGPPLGYGSPKSNLWNGSICEQSQGRQDAAAGAAICPLQSHSWVSVPSVGSGEVRGTRLEAVPAIGVRSHLVLLNFSCCPGS